MFFQQVRHDSKKTVIAAGLNVPLNTFVGHIRGNLPCQSLDWYIAKSSQATA